MGRDGFLNTGSHSLALDHDEYHGSGEMRPTSVEEHIIFLTGLDIHLPTVGKPKFNFVEGFLRDGYETLFRSFAHHSDVALLYEEVAELECDEFADTQSAGKERFDNRPIALPFPFGEVYACLEHIHLTGGEYLWQMSAEHRTLQQFRRIVVTPTVGLHEPKEGSHPTKYATLGAWPDADIVECRSEMLQVGLLYTSDAADELP